MKQLGFDISRNSSFVEKGKRNPNSFSRNKIQVINILLPVPVVIPKISHSISRLGFLLSLTRVNTKCSLVVSLASSFHVGLDNSYKSTKRQVSEIDYLDVLVLELSSLCFREPFDTFMHRSFKEQITIQRISHYPADEMYQL